MNKVTLGYFDLARAISGRLLETQGYQLHEAIERLRTDFMRLEHDRPRMGYNTGSITLAAGVHLFMLARHFRPHTIFEIGTFLGKSTTALALGAGWEGTTDVTLHTCDKDNECCLPQTLTGCSIIANSKTTSTDALRRAQAAGDKIDLFFIDGRVQEADIPLITTLAHPKTVFLLDDFQGIEKGVVNAMLLTRHFPNLMLLPPFNHPLLSSLGVLDTHGVAMLLPPDLLQVTRQ